MTATFARPVDRQAVEADNRGPPFSGLHHIGDPNCRWPCRLETDCPQSRPDFSYLDEFIAVAG